MLGGLDRPSAGKLFVDGKDMLTMSERQLIRYKRESVGFVWQNNARNLIPYLTAQENVELPVLLKGRRKKARALELLDAVGLQHRRHNRLSELSGGEQQRVAIAIALANQPRLLLADEPTGSLDSKTASQVLDLFRRLNRELGLTIVIVTHDPQLARKVDRVVAIRDGRTSSEMIRTQADDEEENNTDSHGGLDQAETHTEYAVIDKAGRLQIPAAYLDNEAFKDHTRVKVEWADGRIVLSPPETAKIER
jgi:ABC-type lipoprotein export system ATPase subunit